MTRCAAITGRSQRHQQTWRKDCENSAAQIIDGVPLCKTHINALATRPIMVRTVLHTPMEFKRT